MNLQRAAVLASLFLCAAALSCRSGPQPWSCTCQPGARSPASNIAEPLPPPEDKLGVAGAPINETEFDFEPEVSKGPPALETEGVPPVSEALKAELAPYLDSRRARLQAVGVSAGSITVISRLDQTAQAYRVKAPLGELEQITFTTEPITQFAQIPSGKGAFTYRTDVGGSEDYQIVRHDPGHEPLPLTGEESRSGPFVWSPSGDLLAYTSNARAAEDMDIYLASREREVAPRLLLERRGSWTASSWSADGRQLLIRNYLAYNHSTIHVVDVESGESQELAPLSAGVAYTRARFGPDGAIYTISNREGEFLNLWRVDPAEDRWENLTADLAWDVDEFAVHAASGRLAYTTNEDGLSRLWLHEAEGRRELPLPRGVVSSLRFARGGEVLAFTFDRPTETGDAYLYDLTEGTLTRWTNSMPPQIDASSFVEPRPIRFRSFDDLEIPAWAYIPEGPGPHPVLIWVHEGPESQYQPTFNPILQYLVTRLGIAVIGPNIRGSTGYGRTYTSLDDGPKREDAIRDIGALLDWIDAEATLDGGRVGIYGGSYGGYVVLAAMIRYGARLAAGCNMVGVSDFVTFLENTRSYRRDNRRAEYGDERDPQMRALLEALSPLGKADQIVRPLFIAHGANDPRVPLSEARQMFEAVRTNGQDAWLMIAHDEGHGFSKRHNRDAFYGAFVTFFRKHLTEQVVE